MAYGTNAAISVSIDGTTWYDLTDHNRQPLTYTPQRIETSQRMANGSMRKMVVANKAVYDVSWQTVPSGSQTITTQSGKPIASFSPTVDGKMGAGFLKSFYDQHAFHPIWIKLTYATDNPTGTSHVPSKLASPSQSNNQLLKVFITDFKYTVTKRFTLVDHVDMSIQFTEV